MPDAWQKLIPCRHHSRMLLSKCSTAFVTTTERYNSKLKWRCGKVICHHQRLSVIIISSIRTLYWKILIVEVEHSFEHTGIFKYWDLSLKLFLFHKSQKQNNNPAYCQYWTPSLYSPSRPSAVFLLSHSTYFYDQWHFVTIIIIYFISSL